MCFYVMTSRNPQRSFCFTNMPTCKGRPVQWTPRLQSFCARNYISSTRNLPLPTTSGKESPPYWPASIIMPHIALSYYGIIPKAHTILAFLNHLCRKLPCHIMALYQKGIPYWPSSIIYAAYCLAILWHVNRGWVVEVCGVMLCQLGITLPSKALEEMFKCVWRAPLVHEYYNNISFKRGQILCLL